MVREVAGTMSHLPFLLAFLLEFLAEVVQEVVDGSAMAVVGAMRFRRILGLSPVPEINSGNGLRPIGRPCIVRP